MSLIDSPTAHLPWGSSLCFKNEVNVCTPPCCVSDVWNDRLVYIQSVKQLYARNKNGKCLFTNCLGGGDDTGFQMVQCGTTYVTQNGGKDMPALQSSLVLLHLIEFSLWYTRIIVFLSDILMAHVAYNYVVIICLSAPSRDAELYCRCHLQFGLIPITSRQSGLKYTYSRIFFYSFKAFSKRSILWQIQVIIKSWSVVDLKG